MNKALLTSFYCTLETLSPIHVGSGAKYIKNVDFFYEHSTLHIVDTRGLFDAIEEACREDEVTGLTRAIEDKSFSAWLEKKGIEIRKFARASYKMPNFQSNEILEYLKDGRGRPIVPGSSLKGSFRTAVLRNISEIERYDVRGKVKQSLEGKAELRDKDLKRLDAIVTRELLGEDPNHDLFRTLSVSDFTFEKGALVLHEVTIKSLQKNQGLGEKDFKIFPELLAPGRKAFGVVSFDNFLPSQDSAKRQRIFGFKANLDLEFLRSATRTLTCRIAEKEVEFFRARNSNLVTFYENLLSEMDKLKENELITRISWGSGWRSMTGELLEQQDLDSELRKKLKLAPHRLSFEFPKSRKVVKTESGEYPLGWIKVSFREMDAFRQDELERSRRRKEEKLKLEQLRAEEERRKKEQEEREAYLRTLSPEERDIVRVRDEDVTEQEVVEIYGRIDQFPEDKKRELALALKEYWHKQGKWAGKLSKKQKQKVQKCKSILGE